MNIFGIGTDIINIKRIKKALNKNNQTFKKRIFTTSEIKMCEKRINKTECFAKRFAAKEALFKAVGLPKKLQFCDVQITNTQSGTPKFIIRGTSLKNLKKLFKNRKFKIHLSLSDDKPWAIATVIIFLY